MNREEWRQTILADNKQVQDHPIIWDHLTPEQQKATLAFYDFWAADNAVTNAALDDSLARYNQRSLP